MFNFICVFDTPSSLICHEKVNQRVRSNFNKCGALHDLVLFVQFKKREKHPWKSVNFSKAAG